MRPILTVYLGLFLLAPAATAQVRFERPRPPTTAEIEVTYTEPSDEGQAARLRDIVGRVKSTADQLEVLDRVEIVIVHSQQQFRRRLGSEPESESAVSYVHGILFLSPLSWTRNPTGEALQVEMEEALVRYTVNRLAGGNRLPDWLTEGLTAVLTRRSFAPSTAHLVEQRAPLLLARFEEDEPAVGYWAVHYLVEKRGGLEAIRQLLRLTAERPDSFVENLQLTYGVKVGQLEEAWRHWLQQKAEVDGQEREGEGPLVRD